MTDSTPDSEEITLHEKLVDIQQRLKVPKENKNNFGGFEYRNLEDIEDRVKPLLKEHCLTLTFSDELVEVGGRVYIKATAFLCDRENEIFTTAYAREAVTPKAKTDDAQLTGACSSYARKYAAGGLFLIDNTKDADSDDNSKLSTEKSTSYPQRSPQNTDVSPHAPSDKQITTIRGYLVQLGTEKEYRDSIVAQVSTFQQASHLLSELKQKIANKRATSEAEHEEA